MRRWERELDEREAVSEESRGFAIFLRRVMWIILGSTVDTRHIHYTHFFARSES